MVETWAWISGWGIQPERFRGSLECALPNYHHLVFEPNADALDRVLEAEASRIGGYSLGSLLLLSKIDRLPPDTVVYCLAPFLAFCAEAEMGGTTPETSLAAIQNRFRKAPEKALKLFYRLAGLRDEPTDRLPYSVEDLDWGLTALQTLRASPDACRKAFAVWGAEDPLLNSQISAPEWKKITRIHASHHFQSLLELIPPVF